MKSRWAWMYCILDFAFGLTGMTWITGISTSRETLTLAPTFTAASFIVSIVVQLASSCVINVKIYYMEY